MRRKATKTAGPYPACDIEWCVNEAYAFRGGLCTAHQLRKRQGRDMNAPLMAPRRKPSSEVMFCSAPSCRMPATDKRLCSKHYYQWARKAKADPGGPVCEIPACLGMTHRGRIVCGRHGSTARQYGMTDRELVDFWGVGACATCGGGLKLSIDHDHACCPVGNSRKCGNCNRGLLCHSCNLAVGYAKDSPALLRSLAEYLDRYSVGV